MAGKRERHMTLSEKLVAELHQLKRSDKLHVVQILVNELANENEGVLTPETTYEVWSPYDSAEAAATLMKTLNTVADFIPTWAWQDDPD
jgi:hypothetical protein